MNPSPDAPRLFVPVSDRDHILGPADAPVTVVEYGDYECPHCAAVEPVVKQLLAEFSGRLRVVFRNFPLATMHPHAMRAAETAEFAASEGKFWEMHDSLFADPQHLEIADLAARARTLGLDLQQLESALAQRKYMARVQEDFRGGIRGGVNGTPTFFINDIRHNAGYDHEALATAIRAASEPS